MLCLIDMEYPRRVLCFVLQISDVAWCDKRRTTGRNSLAANRPNILQQLQLRMSSEISEGRATCTQLQTLTRQRAAAPLRISSLRTLALQ